MSLPCILLFQTMKIEEQGVGGGGGGAWWQVGHWGPHRSHRHYVHDVPTPGTLLIFW